MFEFAIFVTLALSLTTVRAAPSPENALLAEKYAPQFRFHKDEKYFPSSIPFFLSNTAQVNSNGGVVNGAPTVQNVDDAPNQGSDLFLATPIASSKTGWLKGFDPTKQKSEVHTFVAPKANGVVDIYYWLFTPFNEGKNVPVVGQVGDHVGDWERLAVRTVNGVATQVDFHAHSDTGSTLPYDQAPKFDNNQRPAGYIARGSHGIWATTGDHTYVDAVVFKLQDITGDGGIQWDTKPDLVVYNYPDTFSGDQDWLNYKGAYGNKGSSDCWWYVFHDECEIVTGPTGPYRDNVLGAAFASNGNTSASADPEKWDMSGPFSQVLASKSSANDKSTFTFYLSPETSTRDAKAVAVKQTCASETSEESETVFASIALDASAEKFTVSAPSCASAFNVASYTVGLCDTEAEDSCSFASKARKLRVYESASPVNTTSVQVEDLDLWNL